MKTILPLILAILVSTPMLSAEDERKETPRGERSAPEKKERKPAEERIEFMLNEVRGAIEEAARLEASGKKEEADALRRKVKEKQAAIEAHKQASPEKSRSPEVKKGDQPEARTKDRDPNERKAQRPDAPGPQDQIGAKLKHVEQAIAHLREAGLPEPAEHLQQIAQQLREAFRGKGEPERQKSPDRRPDAGTDDLRREIEELRKVVRDLATKVNSR